MTTSPRGATPPASPQALESLDPRARAVYEAVRAAVVSHDYPPSMREIGSRVGLTSPSSVKHQLRLAGIRRTTYAKQSRKYHRYQTRYG